MPHWLIVFDRRMVRAGFATTSLVSEFAGRHSALEIEFCVGRGDYEVQS